MEKEKLKKIWIWVVKCLKKAWIWVVKCLGWRLLLPEEGSRPEFEHCVFVTAPHTSWRDFFVGAAYLWSCCSNGKILMKQEAFRWPVKRILSQLGVIGVDRDNTKNGLVETLAKEFAENEKFSVAITPEGTRKPVKRWKRGFWEIAHGAGVPVVPTYIDFQKKEIGAFDKVDLTNDRDADIRRIHSLYKKSMAKYPEDFIEA